MKRKYMIHPGFVTSRNDGDRHWIGARRLMNLYGLLPKDCVICPKCHREISSAVCQKDAGFINLFPDYLGRYNIARRHND